MSENAGPGPVKELRWGYWELSPQTEQSPLTPSMAGGCLLPRFPPRGHPFLLDQLPGAVLAEALRPGPPRALSWCCLSAPAFPPLLSARGPPSPVSSLLCLIRTLGISFRGPPSVQDHLIARSLDLQRPYFQMRLHSQVQFFPTPCSVTIATLGVFTPRKLAGATPLVKTWLTDWKLQVGSGCKSPAKIHESILWELLSYMGFTTKDAGLFHCF